MSGLLAMIRFTCLTAFLCLGFAAGLAPGQDDPKPKTDVPKTDVPKADAPKADPPRPEPGDKPNSKPADDKKDDASKPDEKPVPPSPDQLLRFKFTPGLVRKYRIVAVQQQTQMVGDRSRETSIHRTEDVTWTVADLDDKGFARIKVRIDSLRVSAKVDGQAYEFVSRSGPRKPDRLSRALDPVFTRLTGAEYQMLVGPQGEVAEVRGYAELLKDLLANNSLAVQVLGGGFNSSARVTAEEQTVIFGNQVVKPGEKWVVPVDLEAPGVGRARGARTYTLVGPEKLGGREVQRLNVATDLAYEVLIQQDGLRISGEMTTSESNGSAQFDKAAGCLVSLKATWKLSGKLTAIVRDKEQDTDTESEIQNTQSHSVAVELIDTPAAQTPASAAQNPKSKT